MGKNFIKSNLQSPISNLQLGQTLIETLAALFILVMGVGAAAGLAVYAFSASTNINKQIIATGLAREGMEAVRNMRDTNWLDSADDPLVSDGCYDFASNPVGLTTASCYQYWLGKPAGTTNLFCINPNGCNGGTATTSNYTLNIIPSGGSSSALWQLTAQGNNANYGMTLNSANTGGTGFYNQNGTTCGGGPNPADYCRKIIITNYSLANAPSPYNVDPNLSLVKVQSQVWWVDKKCPRVSDFNSASPTCRLELDTYLTNWRNY